MVQLDAKIMSVGAVILAVIVAIGVVTLLAMGKPDESLAVIFSSILGAFFGGGIVHVAATPVTPEVTPTLRVGGMSGASAPNPTQRNGLAIGSTNNDPSNDQKP